MKTLTLSRDYRPDHTRGMIHISGLFVCDTLEPAWNDNQSGSCIPEGEYQLKRITRPNGKLAYELQDVPDRTHILIHIGNFLSDTTGCILPGLTFYTINGESAVSHSGVALNKLDKILKGHECKIVIKKGHRIE